MTYRRWTSANDGSWQESEVSADAVAYLFDEVHVEDQVTVADLLGLLCACPALLQVYSRRYAEDFAAIVEQHHLHPVAADADLRVAELYQIWHRDSTTARYESQLRWDFHGVGVPAESGAPTYWGIGTVPAPQLLSLPLVVNLQVTVCEADCESEEGYGTFLENVEAAPPSLGQLLEGVLWELTYWGPPQRQVNR